jgi:hypothetical protein
MVSIQRGDPSIYEDAMRHLARINDWDDDALRAYLARQPKRSAGERPWARGRRTSRYSRAADAAGAAIRVLSMT